ncbi:MAG: serine/threonine-protein kinase [Pseudomonadaceae bacterium]|nr:serine/threonine-protein kinase [Pseudomonadaceae bacterium]
MDEDRWQLVQKLFHEALERPREERASFLHDRCGDDADLISEVTQLLAADEERSATIAPALDGLLDELDKSLTDEHLGAYRLKRRIGVGGMGSVFLAERADDSFERQVAIKVVRNGMNSAAVVARFEQERRILAGLDHPNIARLIDSGVTSDSRPYFVMEYVDGLPIDVYCDRNRLTITARLELFSRVCDAVAFAHESLVVHRDLKPSNILVTAEGQVKLLDFGIAKLVDADAADLTGTNATPFTPAYAAPEQLTGTAVTTATDVFALGVVLFELLTGQRPYAVAPSAAEQILRRTQGAPPKPSSVLTDDMLVTDADDPVSVREATTRLSEISRERAVTTARLRMQLRGDLDTIALVALRAEPERRYGSADALGQDVRRFLGSEPISARKDSARYRFGKFARRNRAALGAAAFAVASLVGITVYYTKELAEQRDLAVMEQRTTQEVVTFVTSLFEAANPENAQGREVTVREAIDLGSQRLSSELLETPRVRARLLNTIGDVYYKLGSDERAEELYRESLALEQNLFGVNSSEAAGTDFALAMARQNQGDLDEAEMLFKRSLASRRLLEGDASQSVSDSLGGLAFLKETQGQYEEAEALFSENLALLRTLHAGDHESVAIAMRQLAALYRVADRADEAEPLLLDAIAMQRRLYSGDHPQTEESRRQLAGVLRDLGKLDASAELYESVIAVRTRLLGAGHREVAHTLNGYAEVLVAMGDIDAAITTTKRIVELLRAEQDNHPSLGAIYNNLAFMNLDQGDTDSAIENFRRSLAEQDAAGLPQDHPNRTFPRAGLGTARLVQERYADAEVVFRKLLPIRSEAFGNDHRLTVEVQANLGFALLGQRRYAEAEVLLKPAYEFFAASPAGSINNNEQRTLSKLRELYQATGNTQALAVLPELS